MSERREGYYWVKDGLGWEPLRWSGCVWDGHFNDADLEEIGHRIPTPDEPWVCVPKEPTRDIIILMDAAIEYGCDAEGVYRDALSGAPKPEDV